MAAHVWVELTTDLGETRVSGQELLTAPSWEWGHRGERDRGVGALTCGTEYGT